MGPVLRSARFLPEHDSDRRTVGPVQPLHTEMIGGPEGPPRLIAEILPLVVFVFVLVVSFSPFWCSCEPIATHRPQRRPTFD